MKKNKLIAGTMGVMMLGAMVLPVHAKEMSVTYRQPNAYTVTIPDSIDLSAGAASNEIEVTGVNLEPNKEIKIKISKGVDESGVIELSRQQDTDTKAVTTISTTQGGTGIAQDTDFVTFTANGKQKLYYSAIAPKTGKTIKAGDYSGTLTFEVSAPEKN